MIVLPSVYILENTPWQQLLDFALRFLVAMLCGGLIGFERTKRFKGAGLRTHIIVCSASALFMIVSKYGFINLAAELGMAAGGVHDADPARIAAQVVSGISFLGAGVIFKNKGAVSGLTTAAGLWATSGIGLAIGGGMYIIGIFATVMIALFQYLLHKFKIGAENKPLYQLSFTVHMTDEFQQALDTQLKEWASHIIETRMSKKDSGLTVYDISIRATYKITAEDILDFFKNREEVKNVSVIMP